jgi:hypothetical protein
MLNLFKALGLILSTKGKSTIGLNGSLKVTFKDA